MKALRILGIVFGIALALVAVLLGALYALFDGEKLKAELTRVVMEQKQRKLDIAGPLELSVWPDVGIKLGRLTLSEPGGKEGFLALDAARVAVAVMPLLSKQVQVQRIEVDGLKATLVKRKDGTLNIADLAGGGDKEAAAKAAPKVGAGDTAMIAGEGGTGKVQLDAALAPAVADVLVVFARHRVVPPLAGDGIGAGEHLAVDLSLIHIRRCRRAI